jgi:hypothetical protein
MRRTQPSIDSCAGPGSSTWSKPRLATGKIEGVPDIPMFRKNTAAFVHELPAGAISNVESDSNYVRVQVLTNARARSGSISSGNSGSAVNTMLAR